MLAFKLTMPRAGSWNGRWSREGRLHCLVRRASKRKEDELAGREFYYDFGDGWVARVSVERVDSRRARKLRRMSAGFAGYEWMVDEIINHGRIRSYEERYSEQGDGDH